jgi:hypothetical protein
VKGFYSVTLTEEGYERTAGLLTKQMDHKLIAEKGNRFRFSASGKPGDLVDIICSPDSLRGLGGGGTVHHVAFATPTDESQLTFREKVNSKGTVNTTPVLDRQYFHSIYFREPGGVLWDGFSEWAASVPKQIKESGHYPKNFSAKENADGNINVIVDFDWEGISVDDKPMIAETHHEWVLENNPDERFAKMKRMDVVQTKPFQLVETQCQ